MGLSMMLSAEQQSLLMLPELRSEVKNLDNNALPIQNFNIVGLNKRSRQPKRAYIHDYHDRLHDPVYGYPDKSSSANRGGVQVQFPEKLYNMLDRAEDDGIADIVSWQLHGRCFIVHQPQRFVKEVLQK